MKSTVFCASSSFSFFSSVFLPSFPPACISSICVSVFPSCRSVCVLHSNKRKRERKQKRNKEEEKEEEEEESSVEGLDVVNSECAVCISEFQENEQGRILPLCGHSFHTECIDMWLYSHSTCPLCRALVVVAEVSPSSSTQTVLVVHEQPHDVRPEEEDSHGIDLPTTSFAFWASPLDPDRLALPQTVPSQVVSSPSGTSTPWPSQLSPRVATSCPSPLSPSTASARSVSFSHGVIPSQVSLGMPQARPFQSSRPPPIARRSLSHIRIDVPSSPRSVSISRCQSPRSDQGASPRPLRSPIRSPGIRMAIKRMLSGQSSREKDVCGCSHDHEQGVENMAMKDHSTSTSQDYATLHND